MLSELLPLIEKVWRHCEDKGTRGRTVTIKVKFADFELIRKRRGYRWCDGSDGRPRSWYIDVGEDQLGNEIAFLKTEIYPSEVEPRLQTLTALSRFSVRA
jgi:DNA polymerase III subunit epsilon